MKVLVVYGTTEGQTLKIAEHVAERLRHGGHPVELFDSARPSTDLNVADFGAVVVVGSIHQEVHQQSVIQFVQAHLDALSGKPSLFLSVSLSAAFDDSKADAQGYVERFVADTGWQPTRTDLVAGAVRPSQYDYFEEQLVEHVVLKGRDSVDPEAEQELTDWDALSSTADAFAQSLSGGGLGA